MLSTLNFQLLARSPAGLTGWTKLVKPVPPEIDEWTHFLHDASGNAVAHDEVVGPPRHIQWTAEPRYDRSHEHIPNIYALVSTGEIVKAYENTRGTEEVVLHRGTLLLLVRSVTAERTAELAKWKELLKRRSSPLDKRESAEPLVKRLRATEAKGDKAVLALDADTGRVLWKKDGADVSGLRTNSLCAEGGRVFYENGNGVVCLDLGTGAELWSESSAALRTVCQGSVFCADGKTVTALSAETGQPRWTQATLLTEIRDVFVAGGSLWVGGFKPFPTKRGPSWGAYFVTQFDLATGEVLMHVEPENPGHHHRCYINKATDRYILGGRRGTEFIDLASGDVLWNSWARGACKYGVMPCNGLLYAPPHPCACYVGAKLTGFNALAPKRQNSEFR